ncbi:MAG: PqqD family protein [Okeania sp. SIO2D1]|nr:PqqD family protein [Okeania sp. SIO2D1]
MASSDCTISQSSIVVATTEQVSSEVGGDTVILHMQSGVYYGLDEVGNTVWNLLQEPKTVEEVRDTLLAEYEVESQQCHDELVALLQDLAAQGLIEVRNEALA